MKRRIARGVCIWTIGLFFISCMTPLFCENVAANANIEVEAAITDMVAQVDVSPGGDGFVIYNGTITLNDPADSAADTNVTLNASCSDGGTAVITPTKTTLSGDGDTNSFVVEVTIPLGTTCTVTPIVMVSGTWEQAGVTGNLTNATCPVEVLQFSAINVTCQSPVRTASGGDHLTFSLKIENQGNGQETYIVDIVNRDDLEGWTLPPRQRMTVEENSSKTLTLSLTVGSSPGGEDKDIMVRVVSDALGGVSYYNLTVKLGGPSIFGTGTPGSASPTMLVIMVIVAVIVIIIAAYVGLIFMGQRQK